MAYRLTKREHTRLKSALTRAQNSGDPRKVLRACSEAFRVFERDGYPDTWHRWERAREDARLAVERSGAEPIAERVARVRVKPARPAFEPTRAEAIADAIMGETVRDRRALPRAEVREALIRAAERGAQGAES